MSGRSHTTRSGTFHQVVVVIQSQIKRKKKSIGAGRWWMRPRCWYKRFKPRWNPNHCRRDHYYIQSLLWKNSLVSSPWLIIPIAAAVDVPHPSIRNTHYSLQISQYYQQQLPMGSEGTWGDYRTSATCQIDPKMAGKWHVNDTRKIRFDLFKYFIRLGCIYPCTD
jgi:hypothetical protein